MDPYQQPSAANDQDDQPNPVADQPTVGSESLNNEPLNQPSTPEETLPSAHSPVTEPNNNAGGHLELDPVTPGFQQEVDSAAAAPSPQPAPEQAENTQSSQQPVQNQAAVATQNPGQTFGIVGIVFAFFIPLVGLIFSIISRKNSKKANAPTTLGTIGLVLNIVSLTLGLIFFAVMIYLGSLGMQEAAKESQFQAEQRVEQQDVQAEPFNEGSQF